jgi:hypothetical protein
VVYEAIVFMQNNNFSDDDHASTVVSRAVSYHDPSSSEILPMGHLVQSKWAKMMLNTNGPLGTCQDPVVYQ